MRHHLPRSPILTITNLSLGSHYVGGSRVSFRVWAPEVRGLELQIEAPAERRLLLARNDDGYHEATVEGVEPGATYYYRLDGGSPLPDPASRHQPRGVHGPSQVVTSAFAWTDDKWDAPEIDDYVIYELHVGTFTAKGTFEAVLERIPHLKELGVTAIELMPVSQFPGGRNWGYDGVLPFAAQDTYGGPEGLRHMVDGCHREGLAVILDVVYNHLGPEGNHLRQFGPYFTEAYNTPWGAALNFDGAGSDEVRRFFIESALYWARDCHIDAFRLDAVHAIIDPTAYPFLEELSDSLHAEAERSGRRIQVIAESSLNDPRLVRDKEHGGFALDGFWNDDFHHAVHSVLTGETSGYYADFGSIDQLAKTLGEGLVYSGEYSAFRERRHGRSPEYVPAKRYVVSIQNHDQVGNRMLGERLSALLPFEAQKLAAGLMLAAPFVPLLFMGEEYGEPAPFQYFVSHTDPDLVEAVRQGRRAEFKSFGWQEEAPDPQDEATFLRAKVEPSLARAAGPHKALFRLYKELLGLRRRIPALAALSFEGQEVTREGDSVIVMRRATSGSKAAVFFNLGAEAVDVPFDTAGDAWHKRLDTADEGLDGPGSLTPEVLGGSLTLRLQPSSCLILELAGG